MHGRVRILKTAEQERLLKEKKLNTNNEYKTLCKKLWSFRLSKSFGDEQLTLIASLLQISPETTTFWNYRREIINNLILNSEDNSKDLVKLFENELKLTSLCITNSPKSYPIWHYRSWIMQNHPKPNWLAEIDFCNFSLKCDERNFHCWDYRRFVVRMGLISSEVELKYTNSALESNLSNYSAWHYRSELLSSFKKPNGICSPLDPSPFCSVENDCHLDCSLPCNELDLVHNAIFTDPSDQSPWFYYWWLLSNGERKAYLREVYLSRTLGRLVLVFTDVKPLSTLQQIDVSIKIYPTDCSNDDYFVLTSDKLGGWIPVLDGGLSAVWYLPLTQEHINDHVPESQKHLYQANQCTIIATVCVKLPQGSSHKKICKEHDCPDDHIFCLTCTMDSTQSESLTRVSLDPLRLLNTIILPTHDPEDLRNELKLVKELSDLVPNNKWALLTLVSLLRFIRPEEFQNDVCDIINRLMHIDPQRFAYYEDLRSAYAAQDTLVEVYKEHRREILLHNLNMNHIYYLDWYTLMTKMDLSNNSITDIPDTFSYLICLTELNMDDNKLRSLNGISRLPSLINLSVQRNLLANFNSIEDLFHSTSLRMVCINGNKVVQLDCLTEFLSSHPGFKRQGHSLSIVYDK